MLKFPPQRIPDVFGLNFGGLHPRDGALPLSVRGSIPTCEELEGRVSLRAHYFDPAEERKGDAVGGPGEGLDVPARAGLRVPELSAREGQHVEMRGAQLPVQLLQRHVVRLRLLAAARHVYNQRRLSKERGETRGGGGGSQCASTAKRSAPRAS